MPNITAYIDNETYIGFLKLSDNDRKEIRENIVIGIKNRIKNKCL